MEQHEIELEEFYGDGRRILAWLTKNMQKFYSKSGYVCGP
mgnify:CR=1 FL=1